MIAKTNFALNDILKERLRQDALKAQGKFKYTCADYELSIEDCMLVLMEEVGETCRAVLEYRRLTVDRSGEYSSNVSGQKIKEECVQVAAVALAICERFVDPDE